MDKVCHGRQYHEWMGQNHVRERTVGGSAAQERGKPLLGDWDSSRASWGAGLQQGPLPTATSSFLDHPSSP